MLRAAQEEGTEDCVDLNKANEWGVGAFAASSRDIRLRGWLLPSRMQNRYRWLQMITGS
jgi:hypothetical protein